MTVNNREKSVH